MKAQNHFMDKVKSSYLVQVITILGIFAFISVVLFAWPALERVTEKTVSPITEKTVSPIPVQSRPFFNSLRKH